MTHYLSAEQILFIHTRLIKETGGDRGIRDLGLLRSATARPQATFDQTDLYPDIFFKAAALFESLVNNHPFVDGNKRTGIVSAVLFLQINGYSFQTSQEEMVSFTLSVAQGTETIESISSWLDRYTK
ncbi:MAG TPA: type II toxin-antitoxin system death-on-curing family toxin [Anaerolineales bacterium]|nr:type II toxin-antitoxin system death-on-curing family toxin [Anaerolineales bacterium]